MQSSLPDIGELFVDKYRIDEALGEGSFGVVFRATTEATGRPVAIKILKPSKQKLDVVAGKRFQREMRTIAQLQSPHTVTLYDYGRTDDDLRYMVCEYIDGEDLHQLLRRRGTLGEHEVAWVLYQALQSLAEAHELGVLHRDIKPSNMRVYEYENDPLRLKLLDFGLAKSLESEDARLTATGTSVGTPRYMAPEQRYGLDLSVATDLYSLGLIACEALLGRDAPVFANYNPGREVHISPADPVSEPMREVVNRLLEYDPAQRYASAREALTDVRLLRRKGAAPERVVELGEESSAPAELRTDRLRQETPTTRQIAAEPARPLQRGSERGAVPSRVPPPSTDAGTPAPPSARVPGALAEAPPARSNRPLVVAAVMLVAVVLSLGVVALTLLDDEPLPPPGVRSVPFVAESSVEPVADPDVSTPAAADLDLGPLPEASGCGQAAPFSGPGELRAQIGPLDQRATPAYLPAGYEPDRKYPLLVLLHENGETADQFLDYSRLGPVTDEAGGAVLVAPSGGGPYAWKPSEVDAMQILEDAIADARQELCIDPERIFLVGHASGGIVAEKALCELDVIRAIATSSARNTPRSAAKTCRPDSPVPYLQLWPQRDKYSPVKGGMTCAGMPHVSVSDEERLWRAHNECRGGRSVWHRDPEGTCFSWDCEAALVSCHIDAGRNWDGIEKRVWDSKNCDGPISKFPYAETIWKFFSEVAPSGVD